MTDVWQIDITSEARMRLLAEVIATKLSAGDMITLRGNLGAGKTTFSRYMIRAMLGDDAAEVPSPTFTLLQSYDTERFTIRHFDLYRISGGDELHELEFEDEAGEYVTLVEWPERAEGWLGSCRLDIAITDCGGEGERHVGIAATPDAAWRLQRMAAAYEFLCNTLDQAQLDDTRLSYLQGDASARGYARLNDGSRCCLLMDMPKMPDGPVIRDGKTYSEIAHLAEDAQPFVAIAHALRAAGLSAPEIFAFDEGRGMALIEDLGAMTFADAMAAGVAQADLWHAAINALVVLRGSPPAAIVGGDVRHAMPLYDADVMLAEVDLLPEWYWPYAYGRAMLEAEHAHFSAEWQRLIDSVATQPTDATGAAAAAHTAETSAWVLRDYHSPNLIWMPQRSGVRRVGVIDFQDAQIGHPAYDVVSLSLDARLDVPRALHEALLDDYCRQAGERFADFDEPSFRRAAAILGAQRNTKILGIFARLAKRDGKPGYLRHIPRIKRYLTWCFEQPELAALHPLYSDIIGEQK